MNAYLATIPSRREQLNQTIESLLPQVDGVHVRNGDNSLGDANKFYYCKDFEGYVFICDDDIIYPPDYAEKMISKVDEYDRQAVIAVGGRTFAKQPIKSYYTSQFTKRGYFQKTEKDKPMQIVLTGAVCFHSSAIDLSIEDFPKPNMADIWFSIQCEKQGVERITIAHEADWLKNQRTEINIYDAYKNRHGNQTEAVNSIEWAMI